MQIHIYVTTIIKHVDKLLTEIFMINKTEVYQVYNTQEIKHTGGIIITK